MSTTRAKRSGAAPQQIYSIRRFGTIHDMNHAKGYGFIADDAKVYRFFHANAVEDCQFGDLSIGMEVSFEPTHTVKGPRALKVRREERGKR